jgi:hypothetical protein
MTPAADDLPAQEDSCMDPAILSATSGLIGSVVGATSSLATTWLTQLGQLRTQQRAQEAAKREALYADFIAEASRRIVDSRSRQADGPEVMVALYAAISRMRLMSSEAVLFAAEEVVRRVVDAYAAPNATFDELRRSIDAGTFIDPLHAFGVACRAELQGLRQ